jgi:hypothetical protein
MTGEPFVTLEACQEALRRVTEERDALLVENAELKLWKQRLWKSRCRWKAIVDERIVKECRKVFKEIGVRSI